MSKFLETLVAAGLAIVGIAFLNKKLGKKRKKEEEEPSGPPPIPHLPPITTIFEPKIPGTPIPVVTVLPGGPLVTEVVLGPRIPGTNIPLVLVPGGFLADVTLQILTTIIPTGQPAAPIYEDRFSTRVGKF